MTEHAETADAEGKRRPRQDRPEIGLAPRLAALNLEVLGVVWVDVAGPDTPRLVQVLGAARLLLFHVLDRPVQRAGHQQREQCRTDERPAM
eukprot:3940347-Rhodomonas_salina.4